MAAFFPQQASEDVGWVRFSTDKLWSYPFMSRLFVFIPGAHLKEEEEASSCIYSSLIVPFPSQDAVGLCSQYTVCSAYLHFDFSIKQEEETK